MAIQVKCGVFSIYLRFLAVFHPRDHSKGTIVKLINKYVAPVTGEIHMDI
jgi:hypothetical protein